MRGYGPLRRRADLSLSAPSRGRLTSRGISKPAIRDRYRFCLTLFAGPNARATGVAHHANGGRIDTVIEVAFPPYAYVTIDAEPDVIPTQDVTECVDAGSNQRADVEAGLLIGFGSRAVPGPAAAARPGA